MPNERTCSKIRGATEIVVTAEAPKHVYRVCGKDAEGNWRYLNTSDGGLYYARLREALEDWAAEFKEFLRGHRPQDLISLSIEPKVEDLCSACQSPWELYEDEDGKWCCAHCGALAASRPEDGGGA